jgi:DNA-binding CsgD family transcriptional regulator
VTVPDPDPGAALALGQAALAAGRWDDAREAFESALATRESAEACFGLAVAQWWRGENHACVVQAQRAYALFRRAGDVGGAVQCAVWLAMTYKANFGNVPAANGWSGRAERLLEGREPGPLHGWTWVARAYRLADLAAAADLTGRAHEVARAAGDVDLELVALSQLGLIRVGQGDGEAGFALIDEAVAAALGGEGSSLVTVVYTCCDMLQACELASDVERAAQWCAVADGFAARYGCPFLYAECRIFYGSVLTASGRWADAERELTMGLHITAGACPGLHARALTRLAALRVRQGRLEDAARLLAGLGARGDTQAEEAVSVAALLLARGDADAAERRLAPSLRPRRPAGVGLLVPALDLLVDARLAAGDRDGARAAAAELEDLAATATGERIPAVAAAAAGRVAAALGDGPAAADGLERALAAWVRLERPFEAARARLDLAAVLGPTRADVAVEHARRALETFTELGAAIDADRAAAVLRSLGVTARVRPKGAPGALGAPGGRGAGPLTAREQEVLQLVGAGLSNPEIARRLHVSRKTAAHHVSSILTKLDLRNRAEAAAHAARIGPAGARRSD